MDFTRNMNINELLISAKGTNGTFVANMNESDRMSL